MKKFCVNCGDYIFYAVNPRRKFCSPECVQRYRGINPPPKTIKNSFNLFKNMLS